MKKLMLLLTVFVISISSSFAYQTYQVNIYTTDPEHDVVGKYININAVCWSVKVEASWYGTHDFSYGVVECAEVSGSPMIGSYAWSYNGSPYGSYSSPLMGPNLYFGTVVLYLQTYKCYGEARFTWVI